jgi:hypothetical protein
MITERGILQEIDQVAFDAWYGTVDKSLEQSDRVGQGKLMIHNVKQLIQNRYGVDLSNCPSFHFLQYLSGIRYEASYTNGSKERLKFCIDEDYFTICIYNNDNADIACKSSSETPINTLHILKKAHQMIGSFEELL